MFSEMVDSIISRSGRGDKKVDIVDYINSTIRECQAKGLFFKDLKEDVVPLTNSDPLIWFPPKPGFRQLRTAQFPDLSYPPLKQPGRVQRNDVPPSNPQFLSGDAYYYAATDYFVFVHCGTLTTIDTNWNNNFIGVAYYIWQPRLKYYPAGQRPAVFDPDQAQQDQAALNLNSPGWTFFDLTNAADASTALIRKNWTLAANQPPNDTPPNALAYVTNWMITDWNEMIKEGALAKLFKAIGDVKRAQTSYSLYGQMREDMLRTELMPGVER